MNWHERYKEMKKGLQWTNKDIADITGNNLSSVNTVTQPKNDLPRWAKVAIVVYEKLR